MNSLKKENKTVSLRTKDKGLDALRRETATSIS